MKLKQMTLWFGKSALLSIGVYYAVMAVLYGVFAITLAAGRDDMSVNGLSSALFIMLLVVGIVYFGQNLRFGLANGVSRRSVFLSFLLFLVPISVATALVNECILLLLSTLSHSMSEILYMMYGDYIARAGAFAGHLAVLLCTACLNMFFGLLGYLLGGIFYRLGKVGRYVLCIGLPVALFGALPIIVSTLPQRAVERLADLVVRAGAYVSASPYRLAIPLLVLAIVWGVCVWLLIRRAPLKTA